MGTGLVPGCSSESGGDVPDAGQAKGSDRKVPAGGHCSGCVPGPHLRGVLGERDVPAVVQGLDGPVPSDQSGELSRAGLFGGKAGDRVDGLEADLPGLAVDAAANDLDGLAGTGEEQVVDRADLQSADLVAAVTGRAGPVLQRNLFPGKGLELFRPWGTSVQRLTLSR